MATGIIAEFNPFHNGHKYLIAEVKKLNNNSPVVCVMSGAFVQRGDIAITDKWTRAKAALQNGADLIIELPVTFSMNTAQKFAEGAVGTLLATGIIDSLAFGSESGDITELKNAASLLADEPEDVSNKIKLFMSEGMSYPAARERAYKGLIPPKLLSSPNDILALEYLTALVKSGNTKDIYAIQRKGVSHDSTDTSGNIASASEIRRMTANGENTADYLPCSDFPVYNSAALDTAIIAKLRTCGAEYLKNINDVAEGLENRFIKAAMECYTVNDLCMAVKSKRYTLSRLRRIAWSSLLGITKEAASLPPSYIRVIGMNDRGKMLLKQMKKTASLPVIIKAADYKEDTIFNLNHRAEDIFSLAAAAADKKRGGNDITTPPVII